MKKQIYFGVFLFILLAAAGPFKTLSAQTRTLTPDDLFRLEEIGGAVLSPDGHWLAYVLRRPKITAINHKQDFLQGNDRGDIWVVATSGGQPVNLTKGSSDGSGFWGPVWSPDSKQMVILSTRGGNVFPWLLDRETGSLKQLSDRAYEMAGSIVWLSDHSVALTVMPPGRKPLSMTVEMQVADVATREWPKAWAGKESTASVLESGMPTNYDKRPKDALLFIDTASGASRTVAEGQFGDLTLSPDKHYLAAMEQTDVVQPLPDHLLAHMLDSRHDLALFSFDGKRVSIGKEPAANFIRGSLRWSPDSSRIAVMGRKPESTGVYVYRIGGERPEIVTGDDIVVPESIGNPSGILWSSGNRLVIRAENSVAADSQAKKRSDWWAVERPGHAQNLTASMKAAPSQLVAEKTGDSFVGPADNKLWRIPASGGAPSEIGSGSTAKLTSIVWPAPQQFASAGWPESPVFDHIIAGAKDGPDLNLYQVDLESGKIEPLPKPDHEADLTTFDPPAGEAVFTANTREATHLWLARNGSPASVIVETNTFLKDIAEGEARKIEYRGMDGQDLKAWMILPPGYKSGTRYPMVAWVYAGSMAGDKPTILAKLNFEHGLNLQLLAAHGYIVLLPSMPLKPETEASDPMMDLPKGVIPAVDKAIELGYADPARLGLMGQSYGGFSTYGLVTETTRFKAAVSLAGLSDLAGLYGSFDARERYQDYPHEEFFRMSIFESGQTRMGNPPWKDAARYVRNSPVYWADRVETPLMIIQGDMDYVTINQGEEFFTALYRQHKRARFVRYWGEGHVLGSPANIKDMWQRIYGWFDEFFAPAAQPAADKAAPAGGQ